MSSANPVGGAYNLLVLEKNSMRIVSFYRYNFGDQYFEGKNQSEYNLINDAHYNYLGTIIGYGLSGKVTLETEFGYYIDKIQNYNTSPMYSLKSHGLSNFITSLKYGLYKNNVKRIFISSGGGIRIPSSFDPLIVDGVELPVELQPTIGAMGLVFQAFFVKEYPANGIRFFLTSRHESNFRNKKDYKLGSSLFTSLFISKHLMASWIKGDWTLIAQIRNEIRGKDKIKDAWKESSGSIIYYFSPQVNWTLKDKWNISAMFDLPISQNFNGTQLGTKYGFSINIARDIKL